LTHDALPAATVRRIVRWPKRWPCIAVPLRPALINALRISYPTVVTLVGEDFFDHAARLFVQSHPPPLRVLAAYGDAFADFSGELRACRRAGPICLMWRDWTVP